MELDEGVEIKVATLNFVFLDTGCGQFLCNEPTFLQCGIMEPFSQGANEAL